MHLVELGFYCGTACALCAQGRRPETESPGSFEALAVQVDRAPVHETLAFIGGEPTRFDGLVGLVERARDRGVSRIVLKTHARQLAEPGVAQRLATAGVTSLDVSLSGDSEPVHDYHTGVAGSFRQTVLGIRRARAARLELGINVLVTRSNFRHLSGIVRVVHALGAQAVGLVLAQPLGAGRDDASRLVPDKRMVWPHLARALELARTLGLASAAPDFELTSEHGLEHWFAGLGPAPPEPENPSPDELAGREALSASQPPSHFVHHTSPGAGW